METSYWLAHCSHRDTVLAGKPDYVTGAKFAGSGTEVVREEMVNA